MKIQDSPCQFIPYLFQPSRWIASDEFGLSLSSKQLYSLQMAEVIWVHCTYEVTVILVISYSAILKVLLISIKSHVKEN